MLALDLRFYSIAYKDSAAASYAKGIYIGASPATKAEKIGFQPGFLGHMRRLQMAAGQNILEKLPLRLSSVAAAMAVGDKSALSQSTQTAYRMAGLSHLLVVSGLHLSVLCGGVYWLCGRLLKNRRVAAALGMLATFLFMAFTGLTPSIIRSGVVFLLVLAAPLFGRRADIYTSLGLAALLLLLQNPFAAADAGLQLSFAATLGAVQGSALAARWRRSTREKAARPPLRLAQRAALLAVPPVCVSLATLPVLALNGFGLSLLAVPLNILALPLLAPLVVCGLVLALPGGFFLTALLARPAAFLAGTLLVLLERLTNFCAGLRWAYLPVGGGLAFAAILLAFLLVYLAWRGPYRKSYLAAAALVLPLAFALHLLLDAGTVRLSLAGSGSTASLVVSRGGQAAVLYRGRSSLWEVQQVFQNQNIQTCVLWVDMRKTAQSSEAEALFRPERLYLAGEELLYQERLAPLDGVNIDLLQQEQGTLACVDVAGFKLGLAAGGLDLRSAPALDVLVPAEAAVQGAYGRLVSTGPPPPWANGDTILLENGGSAYFILRPGQSVIFREASHDILF